MKVELTPEADKNIDRLDPIVQRRVLKKIMEYALYENPLAFSKSLRGMPGYFRFRVGDIRIIFTVHSGMLQIERIGRRDSIY